jgi:hypothetical protein
MRPNRSVPAGNFVLYRGPARGDLHQAPAPRPEFPAVNRHETVSGGLQRLSIRSALGPKRLMPQRDVRVSSLARSRRCNGGGPTRRILQSSGDWFPICPSTLRLTPLIVRGGEVIRLMSSEAAARRR